MKIVKPIGLLTASILTFLLVGCFNPISVVPPKNLADPFTEPFTVDVLIGKDTQARSIAGPSAERIREGIRNIYQLIVINDDGKIVAFDEVRRMKQDDNTATFRIESLGFGHDYHFLLLMGYWKWTGVDSKGVYKYDDAVPPTLLAAGLKTQMVTGSGTVTITMWPIVVDTVFTTTDLDVPSQKVTPEIIKKAGTDEIHPQTVELPPVDWKITWKVQRSDSAGDGFAELIKARNKMWGTVPQELFSGSKGLVWEDGVNKEEGNNLVFDTVNKNFITLDISKYTSGITKIGKKGSANFNLEYVPFNLEDAGKWKEADSKRKSNFGLDGKKLPVWIIRNGMNDDAQTDKTDFGTSRKPDSDFDWNGAVRFAVAAETPKNPDNPQSEDLVIKDGKFEGRVGGSNNAKIGFTTAGYTTGNATAYYAVVPLANNALPGYSAYKYLGKFAAKSHTGNVITLLDPPEDDYNIYVVLLKGGKMSAPLKITTKAGRFVAVASDKNLAAWSTDGGATWNSATLPATGTNWQGVAYGNNTFVAVGRKAAQDDTAAVAAYSTTNGDTWVSAQTIPSSAAKWNAVAYGNGRFVAVGDNQAAYSTNNGVTWTMGTLPSADFDLQDVTYGDGKFVAVGGKSDKAAWSTNGISWTKANTPPASTSANGAANEWSGVTYGNGKFVAVATGLASKTSSSVAYSDDGNIWTTTNALPESVYWQSVAYGNGKFMAVTILRGFAAISTDATGTSWTTSEMVNGSANWQSVAYGHGTFVAVASGSDTMIRAARSTDNGVTWITTLDGVNLPAATWSSVTYGAP